jgi:hypothetical protein
MICFIFLLTVSIRDFEVAKQSTDYQTSQFLSAPYLSGRRKNRYKQAKKQAILTFSTANRAAANQNWAFAAKT